MIYVNLFNLFNFIDINNLNILQYSLIMSGNAALASARRRRAGPTTNVPPSQPRQAPRPTPPKPQQQQSVPQKKINPLTLVVQHNTMINEMKEEMTMMRREMELFKNVNNRISKIEEQLDSDLNLNNISFFKNKYDTIKKQLDDIKRLVVKVQTFSLETNLAVIEVKKNMNMNTDTLVNNETNSEQMSNVLSVDTEDNTNSNVDILEEND